MVDAKQFSLYRIINAKSASHRSTFFSDWLVGSIHKRTKRSLASCMVSWAVALHVVPFKGKGFFVVAAVFYGYFVAHMWVIS